MIGDEAWATIYDYDLTTCIGLGIGTASHLIGDSTAYNGVLENNIH